MFEGPEKELLTVKETAKLLRVDPVTVRRRIAAGRLAAVRVGRGVRIRKEAVEELIALIEPLAGQPHRPGDEGRALTYADPLWALIGSASDARPTDASKKHEYLADVLSPTQASGPFARGLGP